MPPAKVVLVFRPPICQVALPPAVCAPRAAVVEEPDSAPICTVLPPELVLGASTTEPPRFMLVLAQLAALKFGWPLPRALMPTRTVPLPVKFRFPVKAVQLFCMSMREMVVLTLKLSVPPPLTAPRICMRAGVLRLPVSPVGMIQALVEVQ